MVVNNLCLFSLLKMFHRISKKDPEKKRRTRVPESYVVPGEKRRDCCSKCSRHKTKPSISFCPPTIVKPYVVFNCDERETGQSAAMDKTGYTAVDMGITVHFGGWYWCRPKHLGPWEGGELDGGAFEPGFDYSCP
jgi:hypothetical protein